jgi:hypothetical protein
MATLIKNQSENTPACAPENKDIIDNRISEPLSDVNPVKARIAAYKAQIDSSPDPVIKNFNRAISFPVQEVLDIINNNPSARYLRVYNALTPAGEHYCYLAPIDAVFNTFWPNVTILQSCCHCKPCSNDVLL